MQKVLPTGTRVGNTVTSDWVCRLGPPGRGNMNSQSSGKGCLGHSMEGKQEDKTEARSVSHLWLLSGEVHGWKSPLFWIEEATSLKV